jgi:uncharacterized protein
MKRTKWIFIGWLVCLTAQAASFDCAKAQSKVEHLICDNPEISKLDEELNAAHVWDGKKNRTPSLFRYATTVCADQCRGKRA